MPIIIVVPDCQFFIFLKILPIISLIFSNSGVGMVVGHYLQRLGAKWADLQVTILAVIRNLSDY